jgi:GMP synthase-like glutamine amidotransferase
MQPLIGVSTSEVRVQSSARPLLEGDPPQREMVLGMVYAAAVQRAGGIPVVLPPIPPADVPALLNRLQGICLSGGPDLDPAAYHARADAELGPVEPELDAFELKLARAADAAGLPVLGICFGAQVLAAALGGSVHRLERPELGWVTVETADAEHVPAGPWLAWHEDGFTLPPLAYELAANAFGVQAFCLCRHLAVQFHPEVTPAIVRDWIADDHGHLDRAGTTRAALDAATAEHAATAAGAAERLFDGFAARAGLVAVASRV